MGKQVAARSKENNEPETPARGNGRPLYIEQAAGRLTHISREVLLNITGITSDQRFQRDEISDD